jgi:hypothetical protein
MNPKDKANEIANKMYRGSVFLKSKEEHLKELEEAKKYAIICVDEIINDNPNIYDSDRLNFKYWNKVKEEIDNLNQ